MLADVVSYLVCPVCGGDLTMAAASVRCARSHTFDVARQGYVSLLRGAAPFTGDTPAMVDARAAFLGAGHYRPIADAIADAAPDARRVVDLGAGTGHYLAAVLDRSPDSVGIALDASKHALKRAARSHPRVGAVVCDAWQPLPVRDACADLALNVFAPRNPAELARVLDPEGVLVVVAPTPRHLAELVATLELLTVADDKQGRIDEQLSAHFDLVRQTRVEFAMALPHSAVTALVGMGPNAFHNSAESFRARIAALAEPLTATGSVTVSAYRRSDAR